MKAVKRKVVRRKRVRPAIVVFMGAQFPAARIIHNGRAPRVDRSNVHPIGAMAASELEAMGFSRRVARSLARQERFIARLSEARQAAFEPVARVGAERMTFREIVTKKAAAMNLARYGSKKNAIAIEHYNGENIAAFVVNKEQRRKGKELPKLKRISDRTRNIARDHNMLMEAVEPTREEYVDRRLGAPITVALKAKKKVVWNGKVFKHHKKAVKRALASVPHEIPNDELPCDYGTMLSMSRRSVALDQVVTAILDQCYPGQRFVHDPLMIHYNTKSDFVGDVTWCEHSGGRRVRKYDMPAKKLDKYNSVRIYPRPLWGKRSSDGRLRSFLDGQLGVRGLRAKRIIARVRKWREKEEAAAKAFCEKHFKSRHALQGRKVRWTAPEGQHMSHVDKEAWDEGFAIEKNMRQTSVDRDWIESLAGWSRAEALGMRTRDGRNADRWSPVGTVKVKASVKLPMDKRDKRGNLMFATHRGVVEMPASYQHNAVKGRYQYKREKAIDAWLKLCDEARVTNWSHASKLIPQSSRYTYSRAQRNKRDEKWLVRQYDKVIAILTHRYRMTQEQVNGIITSVPIGDLMALYQ